MLLHRFGVVWSKPADDLHALVYQVNGGNNAIMESEFELNFENKALIIHEVPNGNDRRSLLCHLPAIPSSAHLTLFTDHELRQVSLRDRK
jgi:hypothetical protein